jgi:transposase
MKTATALGILTFQGRSRSRENEPQVFHRRDRQAMGDSSQAVAQTEQTGPQTDRSTPNHQCDLLCRTKWLPVATAPQRISQLEHGLRCFSSMAALGLVARTQRRALQTGSQSGRQKAHSVRGNRRQPIDPYGRRRPGPRLRRWQENHGSQTAHRGRYAGSGASRRSACRLVAGLRCRLLRADEVTGHRSAAESDLRRLGVRPQRLARVGSRDVRLGAANGLRPVAAKGFVVLPKRWIVERTFAWLARSRRNSKDYERLPEVSEAMIYISMVYLMSRRLAHTRT